MEVAVEAKQNSTTGGTGKLVENLGLQQGDLLTITCDFQDQWNLSQDGGFSTNANGISTHPIAIGTANQTFSAGAMVGSFNNGQSFFSVGLFTQITVTESGDSPELRLYCVDSDKDNNSGFIRVVVKKSN
ncbi:hypothetical protein [Kordia sp.]|uniref:hypothetical protein n=1 Tax=Kordia sp. TaxID=1965332 RepID=UPI003D2AA062